MAKRVKRPPRALWMVADRDGDLGGYPFETKHDAEQQVMQSDDYNPHFAPHHVIKYVVAPTKRGT